MLFERIEASGMGLTIGSIGHARVRNITFRDCTMPSTYKGIYIKFNRDAITQPGSIEDVLYENITIDEPEQWPIWIGPAQQSDTADLCAAHPCSICWPELPFTKCDAPAMGTMHNITLRRITINRPKMSPGVLIAPSANPATNVTFDGVVVNDPPSGAGSHGGQYYRCDAFQGVATGGTSPVPPCFEDRTSPGVRLSRTVLELQRAHGAGSWFCLLPRDLRGSVARLGIARDVCSAVDCTSTCQRDSRAAFFLRISGTVPKPMKRPARCEQIGRAHV